MNELQERAAHVIKECPEWYHSIELAPGVVTPGRAPLETWERELRNLQLPDLRGKSVLDVGAYDGFFSFAAERLGASRVVSLDHYVWFADMATYMRDWRESRRTGAPIPAPHESHHWRPQELPGRRPFDAAHAFLGSRAEPVVGDFMTMDLTPLGQFDVVLLLGMLYHLEEPLRAARRLATLTAPGGMAVIETEAMEVAGLGEAAFCEFFPGTELNNDASNWWAPNGKALEGLCRAAGFREVTLLAQPSSRTRFRTVIRHWAGLGRRSNQGATKSFFPRLRYRAIAQARR
jgi:tRNA (mo5U34)-methyltransferase